MLVLVRSFSYTSRDGFSKAFSLTFLMLVLARRLSYTPRELVLVRSFSYTSRTGFIEEFLLHS